jgi:16S rRNA (cytosine967-C5)-methyltransferase
MQAFGRRDEEALKKPLADSGAGLEARRLAWSAAAETLRRRMALDDVFDDLAARAGLEPRDEALARAIAVVTFRRLGTLRQAVGSRLDKGLPKDRGLLELILAGAAQILFLDVPDHAAVDTAVRIARAEPQLRHASGLVNALLRRISRERDAILSQADPWVDTPDWLRERWTEAYGEEGARAIAEAHRGTPSIDLSVKEDPRPWAERLNAVLLPTGSLRLQDRTAIRDLPGFTEGAWWVQDAAAALPARLLRPQSGERIADLCAAPGGKTAQLAAAGAAVLAVDRSAKRLMRVEENLARLGLQAKTRAIDALALEEGPFDAVLLDAPCSATGTIRPGRGEARRSTGTPSRQSREPAQARRAPRLLHLFARTRGGRAPGRGFSGAASRFRPRPGRARGGGRACRPHHARRRSAHPALAPAGARRGSRWI